MHGGGFCFACSSREWDFHTSRNIRFARNFDGPRAARRQQAPLLHPTSVPRIPKPAPNPHRPGPHTAQSQEGKHGHTPASRDLLPQVDVRERNRNGVTHRGAIDLPVEVPIMFYIFVFEHPSFAMLSGPTETPAQAHRQAKSNAGSHLLSTDLPMRELPSES